MPRTVTLPTPRTPVAERVPGALFAGGRYRLLALCGSAPDTEFWHARDVPMGRDVALTVASFAGPGSAAVAVDEYFARTVLLCRIRSGALAGILDMIAVDALAVVVSEWRPSRSLAEVAAGDSGEHGAASALIPLALAVQDAHHGETVVSLDDPNRVRVGMDGIAYLAFPGRPPSVTRLDDVRGLSAVLREITAGTWSSDADGVDGLVGALVDVVATPVATEDDRRTVVDSANGEGLDWSVWLFVMTSVVALVVLGGVGWVVGTSLA
ncbi:hypothetical protein FK531_05745 [Rhodococcus spelaei]|uniref:Uncharacterized protein n=1 Tax=Rhodococcus spelaei TaxID=2546320 RepID=A0A541BP94_9NOCA|nr:hypothetical protein [Rhodococcus spelaei]TQF74149.1 hypothetical protein FK531_05745 [Rhodococcus spelaei]